MRNIYRNAYSYRAAGSDSELEALQTDIMRFMAILGFCLMVIFALVQAIPPSSNASQLIIEETLVSQVEALKQEAEELSKQVEKNRKTLTPAAALFMSPPDDLRDNVPTLLDEASATAQMPDPELVIRRIDAILRFDRSAELGRISHPTLVSCARDDLVTPFYNSEQLASAIPDARTAFVDAGGHFYPVTRPELFASALVPFLGPSG